MQRKQRVGYDSVEMKVQEKRKREKERKIRSMKVARKLTVVREEMESGGRGGGRGKIERSEEQ